MVLLLPSSITSIFYTQELMQKNKKNTVLLSMKRIAPKRDADEIDSVAVATRDFGNRRAFHVLMEAQHYWNQMEDFRIERERNKRYNFGAQWDDKVVVDGKTMTEEEYIKSQGNVPLKNNLIRRLVKNVLGTFRGQLKEPTCTARDREEQVLGEAISTLLQYNMQLNQMSEIFARSMEEFLISGFVVVRKSYGWRFGKEACWTDYVQPTNFFIDNNMRDFRGWDVSFLGEVHDISFGQLCEQFATSDEEHKRLQDIYKFANNKDFLASYAEKFGYSKLQNYDFLFTSEPGRCRVIEVWRKEQKPRYRCHDYLNGDIYKIDIKDYHDEVTAVNEERLEMARASGMPEEDVPLVQATWFVDDYWYYYYLSPFGDILKEGETPYEHGSHPYAFKAYPFIDGEIHSFVADVIDQQRYTNRLISMYDWIMRASAKGALMIPEDSIPEGVSVEEFAQSWTMVNGIIVYKPSKSGHVPQQVANNSTNIGIGELLNIQLKFFEDISGVTGVLQGKPGFSGQSASHYHMQTQNATTSLIDLLECFGSFVIDGAYKEVKNILQFYDDKRILKIVGRSGANIKIDPQRIRDVEFDLSITESTSTPAYRHFANDILMQLWQAQAISVEQLLEHGSFPFADELLQSIRAQREQMEQGQVPQGISPQLMQQAQQGANMQAVGQLSQAIAS